MNQNVDICECFMTSGATALDAKITSKLWTAFLQRRHLPVPEKLEASNIEIKKE